MLSGQVVDADKVILPKMIWKSKTQVGESREIVYASSLMKLVALYIKMHF